jgi:hypothetical protein
MRGHGLLYLVGVVCCMLSGRRLYVVLIPRPEECYQV